MSLKKEYIGKNLKAIHDKELDSRIEIYNNLVKDRSNDIKINVPMLDSSIRVDTITVTHRRWKPHWGSETIQEIEISSHKLGTCFEDFRELCVKHSLK